MKRNRCLVNVGIKEEKCIVCFSKEITKKKCQSKQCEMLNKSYSCTRLNCITANVTHKDLNCFNLLDRIR